MIMMVEELYGGERPPKVKIPINTERLVGSDFASATSLTSGLTLGKNKFKHEEKNIAKLINRREIGYFECLSQGNKSKISNLYLPNKLSIMALYRNLTYCGIFNKDGSRYLTSSQDHKLKLYNSEADKYKLIHSIQSSRSCWSILDVAFSPDGNHFAYCTWTPSLFLCSAVGKSEEQEELRFDRPNRNSCTFTVVFSSDGKELLGGGNDGNIRIYDLVHRKEALMIPHAHNKDVNCSVFSDISSNMIFSGGDDGLVKVFDRRSDTPCVGVLVGHKDGITYIDTKGDGLHLISNSKDQSIKLWDIRLLSASESVSDKRRRRWDYRYERIPKHYFEDGRRLEGDSSIMTFRGHTVLKTLVRCRFSPMFSTGQRYIYTGCGTGRLFIYDSLTGKVEAALNGHSDVVRDVAWHPLKNEILTAAFDGTVGKFTYSEEMEEETLQFGEDIVPKIQYFGRHDAAPLRIVMV